MPVIFCPLPDIPVIAYKAARNARCPLKLVSGKSPKKILPYNLKILTLLLPLGHMGTYLYKGRLEGNYNHRKISLKF